MLELNKIYCGDALRVLKTFPSESIDCIITSPPYNLGNNHHTGNKKTQAYDDNLPEKEYQEEQFKVLCQLYRVLKYSGSLFYNHKNRIVKGEQIVPYKWIFKTDFWIKQELVWFNGSQNFDKIRFYPMTERVYWLVKDTETKLDNVINAHDLFKWKAVGSSGDHTRAFPEEMVSDILRCLPEAKVVLDPYMGSGTVAVVAKQLDRDFIGIELNPEYIKVAERRIKSISNKLF